MGTNAFRAGFTALLFIILGMRTASAVDFVQVEKNLMGDGLKGSIHGAVDSADQFVFTYRTPGDFFDAAQFPLITRNPLLREEMAKLQRHDQVLVSGTFLDNGAPLRHIMLTGFIVVKKFIPPVPGPAFEYKTVLPDDLKDKSELIGLVHAVANEGHVVVIEYKETIIPLVMKQNEISKGLYRNDKVSLKFKIQEKPGHPTHIIPDPTVAEPLTVLERIVDVNGKPATLEGNLVLFPQSPEIKFNVFAIHQVDKDGIVREFTLVNLEDPVAFNQIKIKLQKIWNEAPKISVINARNKLLNTAIRIKVSGVLNEIDPGQANAQVLLSGGDAITQIN